MKGQSGEEMRTACGVKNMEMAENRALSGDAQEESQEEVLKTRALCLGFSTRHPSVPFSAHPGRLRA